MGMCWDLPVNIDEDDVNEMKKIIGEKLTSVELNDNGYTLLIKFETKQIKINRQTHGDDDATYFWIEDI